MLVMEDGLTRRLLIGAAAVALVGGCSGSPSGSEDLGGGSGRVDARRPPLVGVTWGATTTWAMQRGELVRVNPRTFRPLPGPRLPLGVHGYSWSYSPDRSQLVLGGFGSGLRFVDLERFASLGDVRESRRGGLVVAVAWPRPGRVLAVVQEPWGAGPLTLAVVDPASRTTLARRPVSGPAGVVTAATGRLGLALLLSPAPGPRRLRIGPARLLFIDAQGQARSVVLERVKAGEGSVRRGSRIIARQWRLGLALDPTGRRAFVVAGAAPVAEVDLRTMRVTYHELAQPISLLGRLRNWLDPAAQAKGEVEGPVREARWLPGGVLAVSGYDARGERRSQARGLKLIDTGTWAVRTLDDEAADSLSSEGLLLAYGCCWRTGGKALGLTAYDQTGNTVWHRFGRRPIHAVQATEDRAYVRLEASWSGRRPPWVAVVDVRTGAVLHRLQTPWVQLVLPGEASMAEKEG